MPLPLLIKFHAIIYDSDGAWTQHYRTKFKARRGVMLHAVNRGWSLRDCRLAFTDPANPGSVLWLLGEDDRQLRPTEITKRLNDDYRAALAKNQNSPTFRNSDEARQWLREVRALTLSTRWTGRTARVDRAVYLHVLDTAIRVGCRTVNVSARDASIGAGTTVKTASKALNRLASQGWLTKQRHRKFGDAVAWTLCVATTYSSLRQTICSSSESLDDAGHETWVRLGKAARSVYYALSDEPMSARALAKRAAVSQPTAARRLPELASYAMAVLTDDGWIVGPRTPDGVQEDMGWIGTNSKVHQRKDKIDRDREAQVIAQRMRWNKADPELLAGLAELSAEALARQERGAWLESLDDYPDAPSVAAAMKTWVHPHPTLTRNRQSARFALGS